DGQRQGVVLVDGVGQLAEVLEAAVVREPGVLGVRGIAVYAGAVTIHAREVVVLEVEAVALEAGVEADEEPELVLDDRATEGRTEVTDVVDLAGGPDGRDGRRSSAAL